MFRMSISGVFMAVGLLSACSYWTQKDGKVNYQPAPYGYANELGKISLLNPTSRDMIHCYGSAFSSAEDCARKYELKNYVRYRDVPYKTANYDFLTRDTYPTRRWREYERTPRW